MTIMVIVALLVGVLVGILFDNTIIDMLITHRQYALYLLMFTVGISVGLNDGIFEKIKEYKFKIFIIPFGIITGSILSGFICKLIIGHDLRESMAIVSGLGWYSLASVSITSLYSVEIGGIAFLSNLLREIFTFILIPPIAKYLNEFSCIAPAAATSEDTTLAMIVKYTSPTVAIIAVFNGVICSAVVPILIAIIYEF